MSGAHPDISPYDRLVWPHGVVEELLATGKRRRELLAYFGEPEYQRLVPLAVAAAAAMRDPDRCVYIVPGIMGSQLCLQREKPDPDDLVWLDPSDIHGGRLSLLTMPGAAIMACGPVLHGYLPLKLALQAAGYTVHCFDYDWRRDIADTGAVLARQLASETARDLSVIGHSMGGLIARIALRTATGTRIQRLITLGTPHGGSYAPVQAIRGVYPLVRRLAQVDSLHSAETLARDVFSSFHSMYQMLPLDGALDLIDSRNWPRTGPQPNATLLDRATMLQLGGPDARISAIAGYGFETAVNVTSIQDEFFYRYDFAGDGTVPTSRATLDGCEAWYCNVAHNELMRSPLVHAALCQMLADEAPTLAGAPPMPCGNPIGASDSQLRRQFTDKIDWLHMDATQRRQFLDSLNSSPRAESR
jgi:pimeloyl-ACP methyl ester carboxylesterase